MKADAVDMCGRSCPRLCVCPYFPHTPATLVVVDAAQVALCLPGIMEGRQEDSRMSAFIKALQAAKPRPVGNGMSLLSCGPDVHFPDNTEGRGTLLVRDFYPALLQRLTTQRAWLLTGVPGTGKSWFAWYAVHCLLQQPDPPAIVWQMFRRQGQCVLFKDGKAFVGDFLEFTPELGLKSTWYFADGMLPYNCYARTIMICPPMRSVYKQWLKVPGVRRLTMPLWTWEEMEELWIQLYQDKLPLARVKKNFDLWHGGVPRLAIAKPALEDDDSLDSEDITGAICSTNIDKVIAACAGAYDEATLHVIHQDGDRTSFQKSGCRFATSNVASLFMQQISRRGGMAQLAWVMSPLPGSNAELCGTLFEAYAQHMLVQGGSFEYRYLDVPHNAGPPPLQGPRSDAQCAVISAALEEALAEARSAAGIAATEPLMLQLSGFEQEVFFTPGQGRSLGGFSSIVDQLQGPATPCYLRPSGAGHPVADACIYPDTLLQCTMDQDRGAVDEELLEQHLQCLPLMSRYHLDYVVPDNIYHTFRVPELKRELDRVQRTRVRVVRIRAAAGPLRQPSGVRLRPALLRTRAGLAASWLRV